MDTFINSNSLIRICSKYLFHLEIICENNEQQQNNRTRVLSQILWCPKLRTFDKSYLSSMSIREIRHTDIVHTKFTRISKVRCSTIIGHRLKPFHFRPSPATTNRVIHRTIMFANGTNKYKLKKQVLLQIVYYLITIRLKINIISFVFFSLIHTLCGFRRILDWMSRVC